MQSQTWIQWRIPTAQALGADLRSWRDANHHLDAFSVVRRRAEEYGEGDRGWVLDGRRGVGKTVLLNELLAQVSQAKWIAAKVEATPTAMICRRARRHPRTTSPQVSHLAANDAPRPRPDRDQPGNTGCW